MNAAFVGRELEIGEVSRLLRSSRLVSIVGPGGAGKSRLAVEVLRRRETRAGAVATVELSGVSDPLVVQAAVARALGLPVAGGYAPLEKLDGDTGHTLLLLDNCEHLVAECARTAELLLARTRQLRVLTTSREVLGVPPETVWILPPLAPDEAARLFGERARARRHGFETSGANRTTIETICRRLDRMPLAIELAAARMGSISPEELLQRLDDRFAVLGSGSRTAPDRHQTLRAAVEWSHALLAPDEQALFRRLAVFRGGFDLGAVEAIGGVEAVDCLSRLVDKSLVTVGGEPGGSTRYALLETLAEYGRARLLEAGEVESASRAHLDHFVSRAEAAFAERRRSGSAAGLHALDADLDNIRAALESSVRLDPCAGVRLVAATREVWFRLGQAEGLRAARRVLPMCAERNEATAWALLTAGMLAMTQLEHGDALEYLDAAARAATEVGTPAVLGWAAWIRGVDRFLDEEHEQARDILDEGVAIMREAGDPIGFALCLASLGAAQLRLGNREVAIDRLESALEVLDGAGDRWGAGFCHSYLGIAHLSAGARSLADRHFQQAVRLLAPIRDVTMLSLAAGGLAELAAPADWPRAMHLGGAAGGLRERFGGPFPPWIAAQLEGLRRRGRAAIGTEAAERAWAEGGRLDSRAAVTLATGGSAAAGRERAGPLSVRETEVARLVADGLSNSAIAERLKLSVRTVENHVLHILTKLGAANRTQIAGWIRTRG